MDENLDPPSLVKDVKDTLETANDRRLSFHLYSASSFIVLYIFQPTGTALTAFSRQCAQLD